MKTLRYISCIVLWFLSVLVVQEANSEILFQDNFDNHNDYELLQYECSENSLGQAYYPGNGNSSLPPSGWDMAYSECSYYSDHGHSTIEINGLNHRGSSGKGVTFWSESDTRGNAGSGWASDGQIGKVFSSGQNEVYVRLWIKFPVPYLVSNASGTYTKMLRVTAWKNHASSPYAFFDNTGPGWVQDITTYDLSRLCFTDSFRYNCNYFPYDATPYHEGAVISQFDVGLADYTAVVPYGYRSSLFENGAMGNGDWHEIVYRVKRNSAPGVQDGIYQYWIDRTLVSTVSDLAWVDSCGNMDNSLFDFFTLGGNCYNHYAPNTAEVEQWIAFDDVVVATTYQEAIDGPVTIKPVLNFSDIISGPKTGNSDGVGSGSIVTVWGNNLGSSQGTSKIYVGDVESDHVYYWKNADGELPGGPADLSTNHRMQEICFSIPATAVDGINTIRVVVGNENSNTLPFTIRTGNIYFIKTSGNDSTGNGSWSTPWATYNSVFVGGGVKVTAGDTIYSVGVTSTSGIRVGGTAAVTGTASNPISMIAYPNSTCTISGVGGDDSVIAGNYYAEAHPSGYVNFSKLSVTASGNSGNSPIGVMPNPYNRIVGLEITGPTVYGGYSGAIGCSGAASNPPMGGKYLGIYIHNYGYRSTTPGLNNYGYTYQGNSTTWTDPPYNGIGDACTNCTSMDRFQHLYYISIRQNNTIVDPYEIGWNNLVDNPILHGIHIYDQSTTGSGFNAPIKVHHNWIQNQGGNAFDSELEYNSAYAAIEFYNNVIVTDADKPWTGPAIQKVSNETVKIWNNTIYGYRIAGFTTAGSSPAGVDFKNNIFIDTLGFQFSTVAPPILGNNLLYSTGGTALPSWYSVLNGDVNSNPLFTNAVSHDFSLQENSSAIEAGSGLSIVDAIYNDDLFGMLRADPVDIGAIQYGSFETNYTGQLQLIDAIISGTLIQ